MESYRSALEELETIEYEITQRIRRNPELVKLSSEVLRNKKKRPYKEMLLQQHEIKRFTENYKKRCKLDEDSTFPLMSLDEFDALLQVIKEESANSIVKPLSASYSMGSSKVTILSEIGGDLTLRGMFSGEEFQGKCLDLVQFHEQWLQLSTDKVGYVQYLQIFDKFGITDDSVTKNSEYLKYLISMFDYMKGFLQRSLPLFELESFITEATERFTTDNLYCEPCGRTFTKKTVFDSHLTGKKHLKNAQTKKQSRDFKMYEFLIASLTTGVLAETRKNTIDNTIRRMALSERERLIEIDQLAQEEELSSGNDDDDDDQGEQEEHGDGQALSFNPHNLPLGSDGHPIPFWLYKLYGLKIEYPCEICAFKYRGRKAFNKHFTEIRHAQGLKAHGIEPNEMLKGITSINEAVTLWNSIKKQQRDEVGLKENAIEVEDEEGNVMSEKVYNDLKRQGLV
ncbi:unnamed protein product [Cyberlindnera jadinii]|uniref:C2H2-type domain-containing protein n=1 Tax=Cyberlindnera jadinii (strain ATCC 18201 / CBS 1600 / BCRC 20928 / JCM 3617 / NBRC 0987 / NRRL Y-1542) TaxID=983966 RepID=A0A0H5C4Y5_CYBJN|nr:unnamed protein product [Cyberlindnera jadinii]